MRSYSPPGFCSLQPLMKSPPSLRVGKAHMLRILKHVPITFAIVPSRTSVQLGKCRHSTACSLDSLFVLIYIIRSPWLKVAGEEDIRCCRFLVAAYSKGDIYVARGSRSEAAGPDGYAGMVVMDPVFLEVCSRRMVDFDGRFFGYRR